MKAQILNAWQDETAAYIVMAVEETDTTDDVTAKRIIEYNARIGFADVIREETRDLESGETETIQIRFNDLTNTEKQQALIDAIKNVRAKQIQTVTTIDVPKVITL